MAKDNKTSISTRLTPISLNIDKASKIYRDFNANLNKNAEFDKLKKLLSSGENYIRQTQRTEVKKFDASIIDQ